MAEVKKCLACGVKVQGRYYEYDGVGPYCEACVRGRSACDICSAPLTDQQWQLSDGRRMCAVCYSTAIFSPTVAAALYDEIQQILAQLLDLRLNIPTGLALVDRNQLAEVIRQQMAAKARAAQQGAPAPTMALDPRQTLGIYARRGIRRAIYVQTGLPRQLFLQVAAHEFTHAWQGENCPLLDDTLKMEGQAEWVSYHVLGHYGYHRSQERMLARQDIYGQGLQWALQVEAVHGAAGVLQACRER